MDHEFELAFNLLDEAASRIQDQQYGITRIPFHNHGRILLTTVHRYTRETGHHLILLATDDYGQMAAIEATTPNLHTTPATRITKVRAGDLTFHNTSGSWSYRATGRHHTYLLTAGTGDEPLWTVAIDDAEPMATADLEDAISTVLDNESVAA
jgi:hypothetical protein